MTDQSARWADYVAAVVTIDWPAGRVVIAPTPLGRSRGKFADAEGRAVHVIAGHKSAGEPANEAGSGLLAELDRRQINWWPAATGGFSADVEDGVAMIGLEDEEARSLGAAVCQEAIFAISSRDRRVLDCRTEHVVATGWAVDLLDDGYPSTTGKEREEAREGRDEQAGADEPYLAPVFGSSARDSRPVREDHAGTPFEYRLKRVNNAGMVAEVICTAPTLASLLHQIEATADLSEVRSGTITTITVSPAYVVPHVARALKVVNPGAAEDIGDWDEDEYWENEDEGLDSWGLRGHWIWINSERFCEVPAADGTWWLVPVDTSEHGRWQPGVTRSLAYVEYEHLENIIGQSGQHHIDLAIPGLLVEWGHDDYELFDVVYRTLSDEELVPEIARWIARQGLTGSYLYSRGLLRQEEALERDAGHTEGMSVVHEMTDEECAEVGTHLLNEP